MGDHLANELDNVEWLSVEGRGANVVAADLK